MFRSYFTRQLTEYSNYYVDWSRIGELLYTFKHRYSRHELLQRGAIISFTAASGFLSTSINDEKKTGCSSTAAGILAATLGFVLSHTVVIAPRVYKRYLVDQECKKIREKIETIVEKLPENIGATILEVTDDFSQISLADENHHRASQTWGYRKRLLGEVLRTLQNNSEKGICNYWGRDRNQIILGILGGKMVADEEVARLCL